MGYFTRMKTSIFFYKLFRWEYWPSYMFYIPNLPLAIYHAIKAKSLVYFTATNPAIQSSGTGMESKYETLKLIPEKYRPKTLLVKPQTNFPSILKALEEKKIKFPLIAKPDIGFRGLLVKKIESKEGLKSYIETFPIKILIQEYISLKNECGIFYHRIPGEKKGRITSITLKKYLTVIGNNTSTISELVLADHRARLYYSILKDIHQNKMVEIPKLNEEIILTVIGNHSKGTQFIDGNDLISEKLTAMIDVIKDQISGWYYGRIDLKFESIESLENGDSFKIIEINGIISEPTHIYDAATNNYFSAIKSIGDHWRIVYKIASENQKSRNVSFAKTTDFLKEMKELRRYTKKLRRLSL